jgi:predicted cupin superfamily sugar epimerase
MDPRARELIALLDLRAHPEGGFYRELYRSTQTVVRAGGEPRSALTAIYYLLIAGEDGAWHRVTADEVWHHYEGAAVELVTTDAIGGAFRACRLGPLGDPERSQPIQVVHGGDWQAASTLGAYSLVGCCVGPGFDFRDFQLARDLPASESALLDRLLSFRKR